MSSILRALDIRTHPTSDAIVRAGAILGFNWMIELAMFLHRFAFGQIGQAISALCTVSGGVIGRFRMQFQVVHEQDVAGELITAFGTLQMKQ